MLKAAVIFGVNANAICWVSVGAPVNGAIALLCNEAITWATTGGAYTQQKWPSLLFESANNVVSIFCGLAKKLTLAAQSSIDRGGGVVGFSRCRLLESSSTVSGRVDSKSNERWAQTLASHGMIPLKGILVWYSDMLFESSRSMMSKDVIYQRSLPKINHQHQKQHQYRPSNHSSAIPG
jgi:hypothetical protein